MKTIRCFSLIIATLFASCAIASAGQKLLVETTLTETAPGKAKVVSVVKPVMVESGVAVRSRLGRYEVSVTPTLVNAKQVSVAIVLSERKGRERHVVSRPKILTGLDKLAEVSTGDFALKIRTKLVR